MTSAPVPRTSRMRMSPLDTLIVTQTLSISFMTSKIFSFGMSVETRTGRTGVSGNAVHTVEQMVRFGAESSLIANSSPLGQRLPVTVMVPSSSRSTVNRQPFGQVMQTIWFGAMSPAGSSRGTGTRALSLRV